MRRLRPLLAFVAAAAAVWAARGAESTTPMDAALRLPLARWPEELGAVDPQQAVAARGLLERALAAAPRDARRPDALLLQALLRLEPLPEQDVEAAREQLVALSVPRAQYAVAWLHERTGDLDRAYDAYHRVVIDAPPADEAVARALTGIARIELRREHGGRAARWLEQAIAAGAPGSVRAEPLREVAVRGLLPQAGDEGGARKVLTGLRSVSDLVPLPDGVLLALARDGRVVRLDAEGKVGDEWTVPEFEALAADPDGRPYVAAGQAVWRLLPRGEQRQVATYAEEWSPLAALAVGGLGELWLADRRGQRIARAGPRQPEAQPFWEDREMRLLDLVWDGARLVALDGRSRTLIAIAHDGAGQRIPVAALERPVALAADPAGMIGVLDLRQDKVWTTTAREFVPAAVGVTKPVAFGFGFDGALHLFDDTDGGWYRGQ